jgi:hypothetical protein
MSIGNLKDSGNQGNNFPWQLKVLQGLQEIANQTSLPLTCVEDSIALCAGGNLLTSTTIGADIGLDVNIIGGVTLEVNLDAANDQVGIYGYVNGASGSPVPLNVNASGQVAIQDGGNSITVDAIDLDIRDLDCATDSVSICGFDGANNTPILVDSFGVVAIQDNGGFITVDSGALLKTQNVLRISGAPGVLASGFSAMSFASVGTADATVDGVILKPGETINIDAGGIDNVLGGLSYDTTNVGSELLIVTLI